MIATFRTLLTLLALILLMPCTSLAQQAQQAQAFDRDIERFIVATQFVPSFKHGVRKGLEGSDRANPKIEKVLALPDADIVGAVAPIFKERLTPQHASRLADFYETETGKRIIAQQTQSIDSPGQALKLSAAQLTEYRRLVQSEAGRALEQLDAYQKGDEFWQRIGAAMNELADR